MNTRHPGLEQKDRYQRKDPVWELALAWADNMYPPPYYKHIPATDSTHS